MTAAVSFLYQCGCAADEVGQRFVRGVLVCPLHEEPVGPGAVADDTPWRGRATIELTIDARDHEEAALLTNGVVDALTADERVTEIVFSLEQR